MKEFMKSVLATLTGLVLFCIIGIVLIILTVAGMVADSSSTISVQENTVFVLSLGTVEERATEDPFASIFGVTTHAMPQGLDDILTAIRKAGENNNIKGIYIEVNASSSMAPATAEAIRKALLQFKKDTGKFIISYGDNYSQNDYYIASVSDKMMINPKGVLEWIGLTGKVFYYKDLLDKAGIHFQIFKVGTYKSAVAP